MIECLELAALDKHSCVAVPALGTGGHNYLLVEVAKATIEAVTLHNRQYGEETSIKKVNIVLLDSDIELIITMHFQEVLLSESCINLSELQVEIIIALFHVVNKKKKKKKRIYPF